MASNRIEQNRDATTEALLLDQFLQRIAQVRSIAESIERIGGSAVLDGDHASFNALFGLPVVVNGDPGADESYNLVIGAVGAIVQAGAIRTLDERMNKY